jgi:hypothetical protein
MTIPDPEPIADIAAQLQAMADPNHPKRACFVVPANIVGTPLSASSWVRPEGVLITEDTTLAGIFQAAPVDTEGFDRAMAGILGLPEPKPDAEARCERDSIRARVVQARDEDDNVLTEAIASPWGLAATVAALRRHVPQRGKLYVLGLRQVLERRRRLREQEQIDG